MNVAANMRTPCSETGVTIILLPEYAGNLKELALRQPIWIRRSPSNQTATKALWDLEDLASGHVTLFNCPIDRTAEDTLAHIIETVDLHHSAWSRMLLIGVGLTPFVKATLADFGDGNWILVDGGVLFERCEPDAVGIGIADDIPDLTD